MLEPLAQGGIHAGLPAIATFAKLVHQFSRQADGDAVQTSGASRFIVCTTMLRFRWSRIKVTFPSQGTCLDYSCLDQKWSIRRAVSADFREFIEGQKGK